MTPSSIKVSRPGVEVTTAAEKDLLLGLSARNGQMIQRGYMAAPSPTSVNPANQTGTFTFTINFPTQQSSPDLYFSLVHQPYGPNSPPLTDYTNSPFNTQPTWTVNWTTSSVTIAVIDAVNGTTNSTGYLVGLSYFIARKRLDS